MTLPTSAMTWKTAAFVTLGTIVFVGAVALWASYVGYPLPLSLFAGLYIVGVAIFFGLYFLLPSDE